jgi:alpha-glucosidase
MKLGVDGFRIDALPHLFEDVQLRDEPLSDIQSAKPNEYNYLDHVHTHGLPQVFDVLREFKKTMDEYSEKTDKMPRYIIKLK